MRFAAYPRSVVNSLIRLAGAYAASHQRTKLKGRIMLWTVLIVLLILWALGFGLGVVGNLIHILLVVALVVLVLQLLTGRRVV
jgi:hypothetical protein